MARTAPAAGINYMAAPYLLALSRDLPLKSGILSTPTAKWGPAMRNMIGISATMLALCLLAGTAQAQTRTWVSGVGDDLNPCSRTAPCKTFAGAISKTAAGGEIDCLDPGGFGAVTITKSITIDCGTVTGGILAAGTNGVNVNAAGI